MSQYQDHGMDLSDEIPDRDYISSEREFQDAPGPSAPKKRASRVGTRSVNNLTHEQLERKRANDREAQRAIRKRTKDRIGTLEEENLNLQQENQTLRQENKSLHDRVATLTHMSTDLEARTGPHQHDNGQYGLHMSDSELTLHQQLIECLLPLVTDPVANAQPMLTAPAAKPTIFAPDHVASAMRFTPEDMSRSTSDAARQDAAHSSTSYQNQPDTWRQQSQPSAWDPQMSTRPDATRATSYKNPNDVAVVGQGQGQTVQPMSHQHRSYSEATPQRPHWSKTSEFGFSPAGYDAAPKPQFRNNQQGGQYMHMNVPATQTQGQVFDGGMTGNAAGYNSMGMPGTGHRSSVQAGPSGMQQPVEYSTGQPQQRHDSLHRVSLPNPYSTAPTPGYAPPGAPYPNQGDAGYQYEHYRHD